MRCWPQIARNAPPIPPLDFFAAALAPVYQSASQPASQIARQSADRRSARSLQRPAARHAEAPRGPTANGKAGAAVCAQWSARRLARLPAPRSTIPRERPLAANPRARAGQQVFAQPVGHCLASGGQRRARRGRRVADLICCCCCRTLRAASTAPFGICHTTALASFLDTDDQTVFANGAC